MSTKKASAKKKKASDEHGHDHGHSHGGGNISLRSAILHVVGDLLQSIGVAIAGALIWWKQVCGV